MPESLLAPTFLFRFSVPCRYRETLWTANGADLDEQYTLPDFSALEGRTPFAELRAAWSRQGLAFDLRVTGKTQPPWCRDTRLEDSDGLQIWIDTRESQNIHRATRFCHQFVFLPAGGGSRFDRPAAALVPINRARENPRPVESAQLQVRSELRRDGYRLQAALFAAALTGYDPDEQPRLGFFYAVTDREKGWHTFSVGPEFPFQEDPSLWGTLELLPAEK